MKTCPKESHQKSSFAKCMFNGSEVKTIPASWLATKNIHIGQHFQLNVLLSNRFARSCKVIFFSLSFITSLSFIAFIAIESWCRLSIHFKRFLEMEVKHFLQVPSPQPSWREHGKWVENCQENHSCLRKKVVNNVERNVSKNKNAKPEKE